MVPAIPNENPQQRLRTPMRLPVGFQNSHRDGGRLFSSSWRILEPDGSAGLASGMEGPRGRGCDGTWWPRDGEVMLFDPGSVVTTRYRPRGSTIPSPWPSAS